MAFDNGITLTANSKKTKHKFKNQEINFDPRFHSNLTIFFFSGRLQCNLCTLLVGRRASVLCALKDSGLQVWVRAWRDALDWFYLSRSIDWCDDI